MQCYVCQNEEFKKREDLNRESVVCICMKCGAIVHEFDETKEDAMLDFYRKDYRTRPNVGNLITTTRKLNYIRLFLNAYLKDKKNLVCADIGAATGYLVRWLNEHGHKAYGTEYTVGFRRFSEHFYKCPLTETIEKKHKYDLIVFYHTLEHMMRPDLKLIEHAEYLKDDGVMLISVPEWLYYIEDLSASNSLTVSNYFHKNHMNCFTKQSFENLIAHCGLEIIQSDRITYGYTVLVRKTKTPKEIVYEDYNSVEKQIDRIVQAIKYNREGKWKLAVDTYPLFIEAWMHIVFDLYKKDPSRQEAEFAELDKLFAEDTTYRSAKGSWYYQNARYEEALKEFEWTAAHRPEDSIFIFLAWTYKMLGRNEQAMMLFDKAAAINPQKYSECVNWMCAIASDMPAWDERAREELKDKLLKEHLSKTEKVTA